MEASAAEEELFLDLTLLTTVTNTSAIATMRPLDRQACLDLQHARLSLPYLRRDNERHFLL